MGTVLGAPNAVRGRSTSPGNLLATEAVAAGLCDALCSDYLPSALLQAPFSLAAQGYADLQTAAHLASGGPAALAGLPTPAIEVGRPLTAALVDRIGNAAIATALWRHGHLVHALGPPGSLRHTERLRRRGTAVNVSSRRPWPSVDSACG